MHRGFKYRAEQLFWSTVGIVIGLIPFWIWLAVYLLSSPHGFWQNIFVFGLGLYFLGGVQFFFLIGLLLFLFVVWKD
jgi:hypothetical protein